MDAVLKSAVDGGLAELERKLGPPVKVELADATQSLGGTSTDAPGKYRWFANTATNNPDLAEKMDGSCEFFVNLRKDGQIDSAGFENMSLFNCELLIDKLMASS